MIVRPTTALVTGYDFLIDQANAISHTLAISYGIPNQTRLIDDDWTAEEFRMRFFTTPQAHSLNSLNAHFQHYRFFPNDPNDVYATDVDTFGASTNFSGTLIFTVGCHSALNVPDGQSPTDADWAQAFTRRGATFIGNTGYGYGDSDLVAYSERLMVNFVKQLGYWPDGQAPTVGQALLRAKQHYYNTAAAGAFSNYDEKVLEEMILYGLPMLRVSMPVTTTTPPDGPNLAAGVQVVSAPSQGARLAEPVSAQAVTSSVTLNLGYTLNSVGGLGDYYLITGEDDVQVAGGRPIQPRTSLDIHRADTIAHGVLLLGGTFSDTPDFDPVISRVITDELYVETEPLYPALGWYPVVPGTLNRFLGIDGQSRERLVVTPGQFRAAGAVSPTVGTQRLYSSLQYEIYHAPFTDTDFIAPSLWQVQAVVTGTTMTFDVRVTDDSGNVARVVVLYRETTDNAWKMAELNLDSATQTWRKSSESGLRGEIEFFAQAVDPSGNVALALDHGNAFSQVLTTETRLYLPLVRK